MNRVQPLLVAGALALLASTGSAQFVKGNEAVSVLSDGRKVVETHPQPANVLASPCPAINEACAGGGWRMLETRDGLQECTEIYARPGTCRNSTYGKERRSRLWIVKVKGKWLQCQRPDIESKCVSTGSLPFSEVQ